MLCIVSGVPVERRRRATARYEPRWPAVFLLLGPVGIVVTLVAAIALARTVEGLVPMDERLAGRGDEERRRALITAAALTGATVAVMVLVSGAGSSLLTLSVLAAGVVAVGVALFRAFRAPGAVHARFAPNGRTVTMTRVHPDFAEAYAAQEWRRRNDTARDLPT
jgi:MFS family permease